MNTIDIEPAFPCASVDGRDEYSGMTLRDYFAAQAMSGSLGGVPGPNLGPETLARDAYAHADAMLLERAR